ncbi:MAG: ComF family protein [Epsilonproteobacteria bacterium]|nr:ComF family protein [Campylobacterota bacterium]
MTRTLPDGFKIYSFYHYSEISDLLKTKHTHLGAAVYAILAQNAFSLFTKQFVYTNPVYALPIDDHPSSGYSHTAILAKALHNKTIKPRYRTLRAQNQIAYSGKSLTFRLQNPRNFHYLYRSGIDAIIVDDIVTSTTTINEAKNTLLKHNVNPLFAMTIADAREA